MSLIDKYKSMLNQLNDNIYLICPLQTCKLKLIEKYKENNRLLHEYNDLIHYLNKIRCESTCIDVHREHISRQLASINKYHAIISKEQEELSKII